MAVNIQFLTPASRPNPELTSGEISNLIVQSNNKQTRTTLTGRITPVAEVVSAKLCAESTYLLNGRMQARRDTDISDSTVWRTPRSTPKLTDFIGPLTQLTLDGAGNFSIDVWLNEGENTISVVVEQTDGQTQVAQLNVRYERGMANFPEQLKPSAALREAETNPYMTNALNSNIPASGTI